MMASAALGSYAQVADDEILKIQVNARLDYQRDWDDWHTVKDNSGFEGKFLNFRIDGRIVPGLTYSWRQRLNKEHADRTFFDATDWVYLNWDFGRWSLSGGKEVVKIGGWEYDRAPIDIYSGSVFWNNIPCYEIGASLGYKITENDKLSFQFCESPFYTKQNRDMYAYNLMWNGKHGIFHALYSANLFQITDNRYISYISLGNKFSLDKFDIELDYINRAAAHQTYFFKDCTVVGEVAYMPTERWRIHAKFSYDVNKTNSDADYTVLPGTELKMVGGGVEFYPLRTRKHQLRLHANMFYSWGHNANANDIMHNKSAIVSVGVRWDMDLFTLRRN